MLTEQTQKGMFGQYGIITAKRYTTDIQTQLFEKLKKKKQNNVTNMQLLNLFEFNSIHGIVKQIIIFRSKCHIMIA